MLSTAKSANVGFSQEVQLFALPTNPDNEPYTENSFYKFRKKLFWATVCKIFWPTLSVCDVGVLCQMVGRIKMKLGTQVGLGTGHIVLDEDQAPPPPKGHRPPNFRPISVAAKWLHGSRCHLVWS